MSEWEVVENSQHRAAGQFIRVSGSTKQICISKGAALAIGRHARVLINGGRFRIETCASDAAGARSVSLTGGAGTKVMNCSVLASKLPPGRVSVEAGEGFIEGLIANPTQEPQP